MKNSTAQVTGIMTLFCLATVSSQTMAQTSLPDHVLKITAEQQKTSNAFWTQERLDSAKPLFMTVSPEVIRKLEKASPKKQEKELSKPPIVPKSRKTTSIGIGEAFEPDVDNYPFSTAGRLTFSDDNGSNFVCSAQFVASNNVIMTAAHCVYNKDTNNWYSNFHFERAYEDGDGQDIDPECIIKSSTYSTNSTSGDYAFLYTSEDSNGGALGFSTNYSDAYPLAVGYPGNIGNTQTMEAVVGTNGGVSNGIETMNDNPMEHGSSGGVWIGVRPDGNNYNFYAVGLTHGGDGRPGTTPVVYGPDFNSDVYDTLVSAASNPCD